MMKTYRNLKEFNQMNVDDVVVTMGNFDGVHRGHQDLIQQIKQQCPDYKLLVITFKPHPIFIIKSNHKQHLLQSYNEKLKLLKQCGVDHVVELQFDNDLRALDAQEFAVEYLLKIQKMKSFCMGHDFSVGEHNNGSREIIRKELIKNSLECYQCRPFLLDNSPVSSTRIRRSLQGANLKEVSKCLGRFHTFAGEIVPGRQVGRDLGFPTANLKINGDIFIPKFGVYRVNAFLGDKKFAGVLNIGNNPTIESTDMDESIKVECHILDFNQDIYGKKLAVEMIEFIRDEQKFSNTKELVEQIKKDVAYCRANAGNKK